MAGVLSFGPILCPAPDGLHLADGAGTTPSPVTINSTAVRKANLRICFWAPKRRARTLIDCARPLGAVQATRDIGTADSTLGIQYLVRTT